MDYAELLEHSFTVCQEVQECPPPSRLTYLSESIFDFKTYDSAMDEEFAAKAVEVCDAITERTTFAYIESPENYRWFLLMCNMPFFADKLEWGTSIRGAWWSGPPGGNIQFSSCGLWRDGEQLAEPMLFDREEWEKFMRAVVNFAHKEKTPATRAGV